MLVYQRVFFLCFPSIFKLVSQLWSRAVFRKTPWGLIPGWSFWRSPPSSLTCGDAKNGSVSRGDGRWCLKEWVIDQLYFQYLPNVSFHLQMMFSVDLEWDLDGGLTGNVIWRSQRAIPFSTAPKKSSALQPNPAYCGWLESLDNRMEAVQQVP